MYLLLTALVSSTGLATEILTAPKPPNPPFELPGNCGTRPPPCIKVLDSDGSIHPGDWYWAELERLEGRLNYFRVETYVHFGEVRISVGGYELNEEWLSRDESYRGVNVYYVPADEEAEIEFAVGGRGVAELDFEMTGAVEFGEPTF